MKIELKVSQHPGGRLTLTEKTQNQRMPSDCMGALLANDDAGSFYRAVAEKIYLLHSQGCEIVYMDVRD